MKFCPECGTKVEGMKFCPECGYKLDSAAIATPQETPHTSNTNEERTLLEFSTYMFGLEGQKKGFVNIPTYNYTLTTERLLIEKQGVISKKRDEIELYKVKDIAVKQTLKDKMMKVGDIEIISSDETTPTITLKRIKDPYDVKEHIRRAVINAKKEIGVTYRHNI